MNRILYIHHKDLLEITANNVQVIHMCQAFAKSGNELELLVPLTDNQENFVEQIRNKWSLLDIPLKLSTYRHYKFGGILMSSIISLVIWRIKNSKFTLLNIELIYTRHVITYLIFRSYQKKIVFEIHNNYFFRNGLLNKIATRIINKGMIRLTYFILISEKLYQYWRPHINSNNFIISHDAFDSDLFNRSLSTQAARESLGYKSTDYVISYAGSMRPDREIENILNAAKQFPHFRFVMIGGPSNDVVKHINFCKNNGIENVEFLSYVEHIKIPNYLKASDILLALWSDKVPTINYCSPLKIFEYMASGKLVLAHDYPSIREIFEDGVNGYFVNPQDFTDLTRKIDKCSKLDVKIIEHIEKSSMDKAYNNYTWKLRVHHIISSISNNENTNL